MIRPFLLLGEGIHASFLSSGTTLPPSSLSGSYLPECFRVFGMNQFAVMLEQEPALGVSELERGHRRVLVECQMVAGKRMARRIMRPLLDSCSPSQPRQSVAGMLNVRETQARPADGEGRAMRAGWPRSPRVAFSRSYSSRPSPRYALDQGRSPSSPAGQSLRDAARQTTRPPRQGECLAGTPGAGGALRSRLKCRLSSAAP